MAGSVFSRLIFVMVIGDRYMIGPIVVVKLLDMIIIKKNVPLQLLYDV